MCAHLKRWLLIGTLMTVAGCMMNSYDTSQLPASTENIAWLTPIPEFTLPASTPDPSCVAPCFLGIRPGQTTITETLALLKATTIQVGQNDALRWKTLVPARPWRPEARIFTNFIWFKQGVVSSIQIVEQGEISFKEIVDEYGAPSAIAIGKPGGGVTLLDFILIYPSRGLAFLGRKEPISDDKAIEFTPTSDILLATKIYFPPMLPTDLSQKYIGSWAASSLIGLYPWPGFGRSVYMNETQN